MVLSQSASKRKAISSLLTGSLCFLFLLVNGQAAFAAADMQPVSFLSSPDPVAALGVVTYSIDIHNNSAFDTAVDPTFELTVPDGFSFISVNDAVNCLYNGDDPSTGSSTVECSWTTLPPDTSIDLEVELRASDTANTYLITATASSTGDANDANESENNYTEVVEGVDLVLTNKSSVPEDSIHAGGILTYRFEIANDGPHSAANPTVSDQLPVGLEFFADDADPAAADDEDWECTAVGQDVSCTSPSLANGDTTVFYFRVKVTTDTTGNITNNASVASDTLESNPDNNTDGDNIEILAGTDMSIAKTVDTDPVIGGQPAQFTVTATNEGPMTASTVSVSDTLPTGYTNISVAAPAGWSCDDPVVGTQFTCTNPSVISGANSDFVITATPPFVTGVVTHQNSASVTTSTHDPIPGNDTITVDYFVSPDTADLSISKSKSPNPVAQGSDATSTISVVNNGPREADPVQVVDVLSSDETYVAYSGTDWVCSHSGPSPGGTVTCDYNNVPLPNGAHASTLTITTNATNGGELNNTACTGGQGGSVEPGSGDTLISNNCSDGSVIATVEQADLMVTKVTDDATIDETETSFIYTVTIHNDGPNLSESIDFSDTIPQYVSAGTGGLPATLIEASSSQGTCTVTNAVVNCALGDIAYTGDSSSDVTVDITVTRPIADGTLTNTASAYSTVTGDPDRTNNSDDAVVTVVPVTDIEVSSKSVTYSDHPDPILAGTIATYTIQVRNNGPSLAETVHLADVFTGEPFTYIDYHLAGSGSCDFDKPSETLNCSLNDMDVNTTKSITVNIRPDQQSPVPDPWIIANTATVTMATEDSNEANNEKLLDLPVHVGETDLAVEKNESPEFKEPVRYHPDTALNDNYLVYEIVVSNRGPSLATGVEFTDNVTGVNPSTGQQLRFLRDTEHSDGAIGTNPLCDAPASNPFTVDALAPDINCELIRDPGHPLGELAAGHSYTRYLVFEVLASPDPITGDVYHDEVEVSGNEVETSAGNNREGENTTVRTESDLGIIKDIKAGYVEPFEVEEHFTLTLTVTNHGPGDSPQTRVTDNLPAGMVLTAQPTPSSGTCTGAAGATSFSCDLGTVINAAVVTIDVPVKLTSYPSGGTITNTASVNGLAPEPTDDSLHPNNDDHIVSARRQATLGNFVWLDRNADGIQNGGEPGLADVIVNLLDSGGTPVLDPNTNLPVSTITNSSGFYSFTINHAADYIVEFVRPIDYLPSPLDAGGNDDADSDAAPASGRTEAITIDYGDNIDIIDAGMYQLVSLGDKVWLDDDADGIQDTGELGLVGVTVNLLDDLGTPINSTITDGNGKYHFTDLEPGDYSVQIIPPVWPGYLASPVQTPDPDNNNNNDSNIDTNIPTVAGTYQSGVLTLASQDEPTSDGDNNNTNSSVDFGLVLRGSVGNFIWLDENSDGIQDAGEPGIANVIVHLKDPITFVVIATTVTDSNGGYLFTDLAPGDYFVAVDATSLPTGMSQTETYPNPGMDYANQDQSGNGYGVYVTSAGEDLTADFGYNWSPTTDVTGGDNQGALGDRIWIDSDGNGVQDAGETGVSGVEVTLHSAGPDGLFWTGDDVLVTTSTDVTGSYIFDNLNTGAYVVEVTDSSAASHDILTGADYSQTGDPDHFAADSSTAPAGTTGDHKSTQTIIIAPGDTFINADFGYQPQAASAILYTIGNTVWVDADRNGIIDAGESFISGVSIGLQNAANEFIATTTTNAQGEYLFENLPDGTYTVVVIDSDNVLAGFNPTYDYDSLTTNPNERSTLTLAGADNPDQDFGYVPNGSNIGTGMIGDTIFLDRNGSGTPEAGEGIEGIRVLLRDPVSNFILAVVYTDPNGVYLFGGLPTGNYIVEVDTGTLPPGVTNSVDPDGGDSSKSAITLSAAGEVNLAQDFGYVADTPGRIGDLVWKDTNADGVYQPDGLDGTGGTADDETPFPGVSIDLYLDTNGNGHIDPNEPKIASTMTNASGNYLFVGLPGGHYNVKVTDTADILAGFWHSNGTTGNDNNSQVDYYSVNLPGGNSNLTADFGYYAQPGSLGDRVWRDVDVNGLYNNTNDTALENITVFLDIEFPNGATTTIQTITDSNGLYLFPNLLLDENHNGIGTTYGSGGDEPSHIVRVDETDPDIPAELISTYAGRGSNTDTTTAGGAANDEDNSDMGSDDPAGEPGYPPMGSSDITNDFGYFEPGSIGNTIWNDINNNGYFDAGEGLVGVDVILNPPADVDLGSGLGNPVTMQTAGNGYYLFSNLPPGSYTVTVDENSLPAILQGHNTIDPQGANDSTADVTLEVIAGKVYDNPDQDFAYFAPASLGNRVWNDIDGDGIQDGGEPGVDDVTVTLFDGSGSQVGLSITTNATGDYLFDGLVTGDYYVEFGLPAGFMFSPRDQGVDNSDSDADPTTGRTITTTLDQGEDDLTWDAGMYLPASLGNLVWDDVNANGIQDGGETGVSGVTVTLFDSTDTQIAATPTDGSGNYSFTGLGARDYYVVFSNLPGNYIFSPQNQGADDTTDSDSDSTTGQTASTTLTPGEEDVTWDAGIYTPASLGNLVWNDVNANGIQDGGEVGIGGVTVTLFDSTDTQIASKSTDGNGNYSFTNLGARDYYVVFSNLPANFIFTLQNQGTDDLDSDADPASGRTANTPLTPGMNDPDLDAGLYELASLGDLVWHDADGNGIQDAGESGIQDVTVSLYSSSDTLISTTSTDSNGIYSFTGLDIGSYYVVFSDLPADYLFSPRNQGGDDTVDSDVDTSSGRSNTTTLTPGTNNLTMDAGAYHLLTLGNTIWLDDNIDGIKDPAEQGIPNVAVELWDINASATVATTITDINGEYIFTDLAPNNYLVRITPPEWMGLLPSPVQNANPDNDIDNDSNIEGLLSANVYFSCAITLASGSEPINDGDTDNNTNLSLDFGLVLPASVGNRIWLDENSDGIQDAGEPGVANVVVQLKNSNGIVVATTITDTDGGYLFSDLPPGDYFIEVDSNSLPTGMSQTDIYPDPGSDFSNQDQSTGFGYPVHLTSATANKTADFGYNWSPTTDVTDGANQGALGDRIWIDSDGDGVQDAGEIGVSGVEVTLHSAGPDGLFWTADDVSVATTTTDETGNYIFDNLNTGTYVVEVTNSNAAGHDILTTGDYIQTGDPDHFAADSSTAPDGAAGDHKSTQPIVIAPGDTFINADFGYQPQAAAADLHTIGNTVWVDADRDGLIDAEERFISGVSIGLQNAAGEFIATTTTDAQGEYLFENLPDGIYTVVVIDSANILDGFNPTYDHDNGTANPDEQSTLTLNGTDNPDQDFGYTPKSPNIGTGMIGDTIFLDRDGSGTPDAGEGIEGVLVILRDSVSNAIIAVVSTDQNGVYLFGGLPAGSYNVEVDTGTLPPGVSNSVDPNGGNDSISSVTLPADQINLAQDFGYVADSPGSIGDLVWKDTNADGEYQPDGLDGTAGTADDETPFAGVSIDLYLDTNGNGKIDPDEPQIGSTMTDASGNYLFEGLPGGDYNVKVTDTADILAGFWHSNGTPGADDNSQVDYYSVNLPVGGSNLTADFGYYAQPGSLGDRVWKDVDGNGLYNAGDTALENITVFLDIEFPNGATTTIQTITDSNGLYLFPNLLLDENYNGIGTYGTGGNEPLHTVRIDETDPDIPAELINTYLSRGSNTDTTTVGGAENDADNLDPGSDNPAGEPGYPPMGSADITNDFGYFEPGSIGNTIWNDMNNDGLVDSGEGLSGVTVILTPPADVDLGSGLGIAVTLVTDASGNYLFENLPPGQYTVTVDENTLPLALQGANSVDPDGANDSTSSLSLGVAENNLNQNFAYFVPSAIGNYVWDDSNGNGLQDGGESGHQGIRVHLLDGSGSPVDDPLHPGTPYIISTGAAGEYLFENLLPATYQVQFILPAGTLTSSQDQGSDDAIDSDPDTNGLVTGIVLTASESNLTIDAGLIGPAVNIEKSTNTVDADLPPGVSLDVGDPITWTYLVTNTGNVTLTQVHVTDDKIGIISCPQDTLAVGASMTCTADGTAIASQYANTGSVIGSPPTGPAVIDSDLSHYLATTSGPAVDIEKSTNGQDADTGTGPVISIANPVNWVYLISNTGNVALTNILVTDNMGVTVSCPQDTLAINESIICTASGVAVAGQYENIGAVEGIPAGGGTAVSDTDYSHYYGSDAIDIADVNIEKATNGVDADTAPGPYAEIGHTVNWTYVVTNTGTVDLSQVTVSDDRIAGTDIHCPNDGNTDNRITLLHAGASANCIASGIATAGSYENTGSVVGTPPFGSDVTDTDLSHYFGSVGSIDIEKATNGKDADTEPGPSITLKRNVTWTYVVSNTGPFPLTDVIVTDDQGVSVSCPKDTLAISEQMTCSGNGIAALGQYANIGSVTASTPAQEQVQDSDPSHYLGEYFPWVLFTPAFIPTCPAVPDYCYLVADGDNVTSRNSPLFKYTFATDSLEMLNRLGADDVETITLSLDGKTIYAANNGVFGIINPTPGIANSFTPIEPAGVGLAGGALGFIEISDIDGMSFDPITGILYASVRHGDGQAGELDLLIQINPQNGEIIDDAFGMGIDYVIIDTAAENASDVDDIAIDSDGTLLGIAGNSGGGGGDQLIKINKQTGAVGSHGPLNHYGAPIQDMEGLTLYNTKVLYGTTGYEFTSEGTDNILYKINKASGETVPITRLDKDFNGYVPGDFEAITCFPICK